METVDAAVCKEIQNNNFAFQLLKGQWSAYIHPFQICDIYRAKLKSITSTQYCYVDVADSL